MFKRPLIYKEEHKVPRKKSLKSHNVPKLQTKLPKKGQLCALTCCSLIKTFGKSMYGIKREWAIDGCPFRKIMWKNDWNQEIIIEQFLAEIYKWPRLFTDIVVCSRLQVSKIPEDSQDNGSKKSAKNRVRNGKPFFARSLHTRFFRSSTLTKSLAQATDRAFFVLRHVWARFWRPVVLLPSRQSVFKNNFLD